MATKPGWLPVATGVVTTGLALWVALSFAQPAEDAGSAATSTEAVTTVATVPPSTVTVPPVVITTPPPQMEGISEAVARVLSSNGFAAELSEQDIASQLPRSVYRTLVEQGAVLTIATDGEGQ